MQFLLFKAIFTPGTSPASAECLCLIKFTSLPQSSFPLFCISTHKTILPLPCVSLSLLRALRLSHPVVNRCICRFPDEFITLKCLHASPGNFCLPIRLTSQLMSVWVGGLIALHYIKPSTSRSIWSRACMSSRPAIFQPLCSGTLERSERLSGIRRKMSLNFYSIGLKWIGFFLMHIFKAISMWSDFSQPTQCELGVSGMKYREREVIMIRSLF